MSSQHTPSNKPAMMLKWADESSAKPISRSQAAQAIRDNRRQPAALRVVVSRKYGETYITSAFLGVGCVIFRADAKAAE